MTNIVTFTEGAEFIGALTQAGLTSAHTKHVAANPELYAKIVELSTPETKSTSSSPTTSLAQAKVIMGSNYHDPAQWAKACGFRLTKAHKELFSTVPFSATLLKLLAKTHMLVPVLPLSIMQLHGRHTALFYQSDPWYASEAFGSEKAEVGWLLVMREVVPGSTSKNWSNQQALTPESEHIPSATQLVQAIICHAVLTTERLLPAIYARTSSVDGVGCLVLVGRFVAFGLNLLLWSDNANSDVGLASARK